MQKYSKKSRPSPESKCTVYKVEEPMGLLDFLYKKMSGKSANKVKSVLKYKLVSVDGKVITQFNYPLQVGQEVSVASYKPEYKPAVIANMPEIIYEDENIVVIDKPAGLLAIATEDEKNETAYHIMTEYVKLKNKNNRIYIVHRLDRDTSGILLFAKNEETKHMLQDNWDSLVKFRGYAALLEGHPEEKSGRIESWLRETDSHFVFSAHTKGEGKYAVTNYEIKRESNNYSLAAINIETGRKNQIRVHMSEMDCPIAGDKKYGARTNPIHRLALQADMLAIELPYLNEVKEFKLPVPKKFIQCLKNDEK